MKTKVSYLQFEKLVQLQTPSVDAQILSCQNPYEPSIKKKYYYHSIHSETIIFKVGIHRMH